MFGLSRKTHYAVSALARLAELEAGGRGLASARQLARETRTPASLVEALMKRLHRAGLVGSRRGARGGYYLAEGADRITVGRVVRAVESGPAVRLAACCCGGDAEAGLDGCHVASQCPIHRGMRRLNGQLVDWLEGLSLRELMDEASEVAASGSASRLMR